jgi:indole-3-glycerol phosphate synthase
MGYLSEIVAEVRTSIARPEYLAALPSRSSASGRPSLRRAIENAGADGALVVEFKRVSPGSESPELPARSPAELARSTAACDVAGYSCLATGPRFRGSPNDVRELAEATDRPILFKDFVIDPVQLDAAERAGASAVLLIARLEGAQLLSRPLRDLAADAHARRLEVVIEFHDKSELRQAGNVGADMYGVNVRDLDTLRLEPGVAAATIRAAGSLRPLVGMSGVAGPADARRFWDAGVDAILVGSAVARAVDPASFLRSLRRPARGGAA